VVSCCTRSCSPPSPGQHSETQLSMGIAAVPLGWPLLGMDAPFAGR
jgi:hypothetical protein